MTLTLKHGRWQDVLGDVDEADALIADSPYSERTHKGQRSGKTSDWMGSPGQSRITYGHITRDDARELIDHWSPRIRRWFVLFGDHITTRWFREDLEELGNYVFPPLPWVKTDATPRILSDGPSPHVEWLAVARPRRRLDRAEKRYRRGYYDGPSRKERPIPLVGAKPLWLMRQLVRDYSEPGDLIVDPFAGTGTTLIAAALEGRSAIGAEVDEDRFEAVQKRIAELEKNRSYLEWMRSQREQRSA